MYFSPLQRFAVNVSFTNRLLRKIFIFLAWKLRHSALWVARLAIVRPRRTGLSPFAKAECARRFFAQGRRHRGRGLIPGKIKTTGWGG